MALYYIYPKYNRTSFSLVAKEHIARLQKLTKVYDFDLAVLETAYWLPGKKILVHPIFYTFIQEDSNDARRLQKRIYRVRKVAAKLGGFDVADSDRISDKAVMIANQFDLIFVPSSFSLEAYKASGVTARVVVLPHGINQELLKDTKDITCYRLKRLKEKKEKEEAIFILYFLWHSGFRKGADLVAKVMMYVWQEFDNVYLIVKRLDNEDPYLADLRGPRTIEIKYYMEWDELRQLYDLCDIVLCPSRGGGFELNAIEAIARGIPVLVPEAGPFLDYIEYTIPVRVAKKVKVFQDNPVHTGHGYEVDLEDFRKKLVNVIKHIDSWKKKFSSYAKKVRRIYNWDSIVYRLHEILDEHGFL